MGKKILIIITSLFFLILGICTALKIIDNRKNSEENSIDNEVVDSTDISERYVTDECINEWKDYAERIEEDLKEANSNIEDENSKYIVRNKDEYIVIYKLDTEGKEQLYKTTDIITKYLTEEDIMLLDKGIEITGREKLNSFLEDFE